MFIIRHPSVSRIAYITGPSTYSSCLPWAFLMVGIVVLYVVAKDNRIVERRGELEGRGVDDSSEDSAHLRDGGGLWVCWLWLADSRRDKAISNCFGRHEQGVTPVKRGHCALSGHCRVEGPAVGMGRASQIKAPHNQL